MRSQWIRVGLQPMTAVFNKEREIWRLKDIGKKATWRQRQRLEFCYHEPRNIKEGRQPPEAGSGRKGFFQGAWRC